MTFNDEKALPILAQLSAMRTPHSANAIRHRWRGRKNISRFDESLANQYSKFALDQRVFAFIATKAAIGKGKALDLCIAKFATLNEFQVETSNYRSKFAVNFMSLKFILLSFAVFA